MIRFLEPADLQCEGSPKAYRPHDGTKLIIRPVDALDARRATCAPGCGNPGGADVVLWNTEFGVFW